MTTKVQCRFVYANGKRCLGHIIRVEVYKADVSWTPDEATGRWKAEIDRPRSHYHLFCSEKGSHAGSMRPDDSRMKFYRDQLPDELSRLMD